jgi:paraquat-inducible protein A
MNGKRLAPQSTIECENCGLLQGRSALAPGQSAHCAGCDTKLFREQPRGIQRALALTLAALVLLAVANLTDFMTFEFKGRSQDNRIITGVLELGRLGYVPLAALILFTSVVAPLLYLSGMLCVLASVHLGHSPAWLGPLFRRLELLKPWSMLEVYLLGILVAVIKLGQMASIELATAFWAYLGLIATATAASDCLDSRSVWERVRLSHPKHGP